MIFRSIYQNFLQDIFEAKKIFYLKWMTKELSKEGNIILKKLLGDYSYSFQQEIPRIYETALKIREESWADAIKVHQGLSIICIETIKQWLTYDWTEAFPRSQAEGIVNQIQIEVNEIYQYFTNAYQLLYNSFDDPNNMFPISWLKKYLPNAIKNVTSYCDRTIKESLRDLSEYKPYSDNDFRLKDAFRIILKRADLYYGDEERVFSYFKKDADVTKEKLKEVFSIEEESESQWICDYILKQKKLLEKQIKTKEQEKQKLQLFIKESRRRMGVLEDELSGVQLPTTTTGVSIGTIYLRLLGRSQEALSITGMFWFALFLKAQKKAIEEINVVEELLRQLAEQIGVKADLKLRVSRPGSSLDMDLNYIVPRLGLTSNISTIKMEIDNYASKAKERLIELGLDQVAWSCLLPTSNRKRHSYILGKSGSGKTELLKVLLHEDFKIGNGVFLLDPHGDLARECFRFELWKEDALRERLVYLSPKFVKEGVLFRYNPLDFTPKGLSEFERHNALSVQAIELAGSFQAVFRGEFSDNMRSILINCFKLLLAVPNVHLGHLMKLLSPEGNGMEPYRGFLNKHWDIVLQDYFVHTFSSKRLNAAKLALLTRFDHAFSNQILRTIFFTNHSSFDFQKELNEGKIILVDAQQGLLSTLGTKMLGALLSAEMVTTAILRANMPKEKRKPVYVYIDECQNFLTDSIDSLLAEARKYGFHLILANQFLGQFEGMGRLRQSILSNTAIKFCGSASYQDQTAMGREMNFNFGVQPKLGKGRFVFQVDPQPGFEMQVSSKLLPPLDTNPLYVSKGSQREWIEEQWKKYYKPLVENQTQEDNGAIQNDNDDKDGFQPIIDDL